MDTTPTTDNDNDSTIITITNPPADKYASHHITEQFEAAHADRDRKFIESDNRANKNTHFLHDNITSQANQQERRAQYQTGQILASEQRGFDNSLNAINKTDADVLKESCSMQSNILADNDRKFIETDNRAQRTSYFTNQHIRETDSNNEVRGRENTNHILGDLRGETRSLDTAINRSGQENLVSTERNGLANNVTTEKIGAASIQATQRIANELTSAIDRNGQQNLVSTERNGLANSIAVEKTSATGIQTTQRVATEGLQTAERNAAAINENVSAGFRQAASNLNGHSMETMREYASVKSGLEKVKHKDTKNSSKYYEKLHHDLDRMEDRHDRHGNEYRGHMDHMHDRFEHSDRERRARQDFFDDRNERRQHEIRHGFEEIGESIHDTYKDLHRDHDRLNDRMADRFTGLDKTALKVERRANDRSGEFAMRNERMLDGISLQACKNTAKLNKHMQELELQAARNTAEIQLEAMRNRCDVLSKVSECCCEIKSTVVSSADSVKGMISSNETARLRDELNEARTRNLFNDRERYHH